MWIVEPCSTPWSTGGGSTALEKEARAKDIHYYCLPCNEDLVLVKFTLYKRPDKNYAAIRQAGRLAVLLHS
jgi:hypothetical protein